MCFWWSGVTLLVILLTWSSLSQLAGDVSYLAAKRMFTSGRTTPALWTLTQLTKFQPQPSAAQATAGYILFTINDLTGSEALLYQDEESVIFRAEEMSEDIALREAEASRLNNLGMLRYRQGHVEEAIDVQTQAVAMTLNGAIPHYNLGIMLWQSDDAVGAIRALREATYIEPTWVEPYIYLALITLRQKQYTNAAQYAETAIALAPEITVSYDLYIQSLLAQGKGNSVLSLLDRAEKQIGGRDRRSLYRALALIASGDSDQAQRILERLFIHATDPQIRQRVLVELRAMTEP